MVSKRFRVTGPGDPRIAVAYIRFSKKHQKVASEGNQRWLIEQWGAKFGVQIAAVCTDACGGATPIDKRPGFIGAMGELKRCKAGLLVVWRRDRVARDVLQAAVAERMLERYGAKLCSLEGHNEQTPEAQLMRSILDAIAQYERALIRLRTQLGLARRADQNIRYAAMPYGKMLAEDRKTLIDNPTEQEVIKRIAKMRGKGIGWGTIAEALNAAKIPPPGAGADRRKKKNTRWHKTSLFRMWRRLERVKKRKQEIDGMAA